MGEPFLGEIKIFTGNYAPRNWASCEGQLVQVSQYDALFSLLGTNYGGNGTSTFGLPDMRGRIPAHQGQGPGLSNRVIGQKFGSEYETVTTNQMPSHDHALMASANPATDTLVGNSRVVAKPTINIYADTTSTEAMYENAIEAVGGGQTHYNIQPSLCLRFIIAMVGVYPSRT